MATQRSRPPKRQSPSTPSGPRRGSQPGGTRKLPEAMTRLAAGDDKALRQRRPSSGRTQLHDDRERIRILGTNNRDCRAVYDARLLELQQAVTANDMAAVGQGLLDMELLGLFRARNVVNFQAFATSVLGLPLEQATDLVSEAASAKGWERARLADPLIALWIRSEAALREHLGRAAVRVSGDPNAPSLEFSVPSMPVERAVLALSGVGRQAAGLAHHLSQSRPPQRQAQGEVASAATSDGQGPPGRRHSSD